MNTQFLAGRGDSSAEKMILFWKAAASIADIESNSQKWIESLVLWTRVRERESSHS